MTPMLAAKFLIDTLASDTGAGQINDATAGTNPAGVASFWTNRVWAFQIDPGYDKTAFPYGLLSIDSMQPGGAQRSDIRKVYATLTIYHNTLDHAALVAISNALYGNFYASGGNGVATYGLHRRNTVAVVSTPFNPAGVTGEAINVEDMSHGPVDTDWKVSSLTIRLMFELNLVAS